MDSKADETRALLLGAVYHFMDHLCRRENPLVVGGSYPRDRIVEHFELWAKENNLSLSKINADGFRDMLKKRII